MTVKETIGALAILRTDECMLLTILSGDSLALLFNYKRVMGRRQYSRVLRKLIERATG